MFGVAAARRLAVAAAYGVVTLVSIRPADAKWGPTEWGMTPEQVMAVMPKAREVQRGRRLGDDLRKKVEGTVNFYGVKTDAGFYFAETGLELVLVEIPGKQCEDVAKAVVEEYGEPVRNENFGPMKIVIWHDDPFDARLEFWPSPKECLFFYSRLSTRKAADLDGLE